ncbi:MAG: hypothetical protein ACKORI_05600, partial [Verrucomicrobiota bacterium]
KGRAIPLKFVRIEPFVVPKVSLTGGSVERVDTRVLQVIYQFERPADRSVFVGQQMDVFIDASPDAAKKCAAHRVRAPRRLRARPRPAPRRAGRAEGLHGRGPGRRRGLG